MPFYDFQCPVCSTKEAHYAKIADRDQPILHCATPMQRLITAPMVQVDIPAYISPASGKWIDSRSARREDLKREGCIAYEPGIKEHIAAVSAAEKEKVAQVFDATVDRTVSEMHASGLI